MGLPMTAEQERRGMPAGDQSGRRWSRGWGRGHCKATAELEVASLGPDEGRSSRSTAGCAQQRKAGDVELVWACQSLTCLTVGALAWRRHGLTGRAPRRS
jgi:hypothetical protein